MKRKTNRRPNVLFVFADQLRLQSVGIAGDPNVSTPHIDRLIKESIWFKNAISGCSVCSPARASLLTGQYPDRHGLFVNDVPLHPDGLTMPEAFQAGGYRTGYIGKWHLNGSDRSAYIPPERRLGFEHWMVRECTHAYMNSKYYDGDDMEIKTWDGYDAAAQTRAAQFYIKNRNRQDPFFLMLSWGPPHNPYQEAPQRYLDMYDPDTFILRPNVTAEVESKVRKDLAGYYAHITALDDLIGDLRNTIDAEGIHDETIIVFWSDHGDMLGSQGKWRKQKPWDESIRVPLSFYCPGLLSGRGKRIDIPINTPDIMPTLLSLCNLAIPESVDGSDFAPYVMGTEKRPPVDAALLALYYPFGEFGRQDGGKEYRGVRTQQYTYVRDLNGPWLFYDNRRDPYQQQNLIGTTKGAELQGYLDTILNRRLDEVGDAFCHGDEYIRKWGYEVNEQGEIPYTM